MYYVQLSNDGGKTFDTVYKTKNRSKAFERYMATTGRALLFRDNQLLVSGNVIDAKRFSISGGPSRLNF